MVRSNFRAHAVNAHGLSQARKLAELFSEMLSSIEEISGTEGREITIIRTKLEEACFFAMRAMASQASNQQ